MRKTFTTHFAWAVAVLAAFSIGSQKAAKETGAKTHGDLSTRPILAKPSPTMPQSTAGSAARSSLPPPPPTGLRKPLSLNAHQIEALASVIQDTSDPVGATIAFAKLLEGLTAENAGLVWESLQSAGAGDDKLKLMLYAWGKMDAAGAMAHDDTNPRWQREVLRGWANAAPDAAIAWVDSLEDAELAEQMRAGLLSGLSELDAELANQYANRLAENGSGGREISRHFERIASVKLKEGVEAALAWGDGLPPGEIKGAALHRIAFEWTQRDPAAASEWANQYASDDWAAAVISRVGENWAESDPEASIKWLETLPQGKGLDQASFTAFREWVRRDSRGASEYITNMSNSSSRDNAIRALSGTISRNDPEAAVYWASEITEPDMRSAIITQTARNWYARDQAAALDWLGTSGLSEQVQVQITSP